MAASQEALNAQIQSQLLAESGTPSHGRRTWLIVAGVALAAIVIGIVIYALTQRKPAAPKRRWIRNDGVDAACGTPCDVATYRDVASYDECLARTGTLWQQVNFFTYNPTTRLCSLKSIPEPFKYKADAALQGATYRFPPTQS
ncbi:collectrin incomplete domain containing protein [Pandoravirus japonicus]|uniref:Collectrin incomplete domain containing protein n=1 Tax=Pandoravirus japonicus TaxID=2823154 RepID=A0A811BRX8_9VIRU|nr:collectrin incomplete domain containing protein [Pandoravirus japonicus]